MFNRGVTIEASALLVSSHFSATFASSHVQRKDVLVCLGYRKSLIDSFGTRGEDDWTINLQGSLW